MRLLDLYCGAGGAAMGYWRAGFDEIVGVDTEPQPRYPFDFVRADALEYLAAHGSEFDAIHASPPCQAYSIMRNLPWLDGREYPALIAPTKAMLDDIGKPWVIENVMGARAGSKGLMKRGLESHGLDGGWLCGAMFSRPFFRHRLFATNWLWLAPEHPNHNGRVTVGNSDKRKGRGVSEQIIANPVNSAWRAAHDGVIPLSERTAGTGHSAGWRRAAEAMEIDWMKRDELTQAIPPVFTEYIGMLLMLRLESP